MFKSKILNILFIIFIFFLVPNVVSAANIETETETLDLTNMEKSQDNLETKGWKWDNESKTLTLRNANFDVKDDDNKSNPCIKLNKSDNITVIFEGINTLKSQKKAVIYAADGGNNGSITFKGEDDAILNLEITEISGIGGDNLGNTIHYVKNLNILSGTINSNGGFWIDGSLNINGENMPSLSSGLPGGVYVLSQVKIDGGNVNIKASSAAIHVPGNKTDIIEDGVIINGGNVVLSSQAANTPAISAGQTTRKNIVINGGNITVAGDYGVYTANGVIKVNGFESFNDDGVKKESFKVAKETGNEIIYADADYSKVDKAIEEANKLNKAEYKDFSNVEKAVNSVIRGKNILEQEDVDAMAKAIIDAINSLEHIETNEKDDTPKTGVVDLSTIVKFIVLGAIVGM